MKKILTGTLLFVAAASTLLADDGWQREIVQLSPPPDGMPPVPDGWFRDDYEMAVFHPGKPQEAGTHLRYPGDVYRYTFLTNPKYVDSSDMELKSAEVGIHFVDKDWTTKSGDAYPEWASIKINGHALDWVIPQGLAQTGYREGQTPYSSSHFEVQDEREAHPAGRFPAYIFDVTELADEIKSGKLVIEITNLRSDGQVDSDAPYGDFIVLRVGNHFVWGPVDK